MDNVAPPPGSESDPGAAIEQQLAEQLHHQDPHALETMAFYACRIEAIIKRKFGSLIPEEDIKDIVAEAFIQAFKQGRRYNPRLARAITWLSMIAHYQALLFLRRQQHLSDQSLDEVAQCIAEQTILLLPPTEESEQPSPVIETLLQRLSPRRARVIRMRFYQGLSIEEIADLLNISPSGIRSNLCRGLKDLRQLMEDDRP